MENVESYWVKFPYLDNVADVEISLFQILCNKRNSIQIFKSFMRKNSNI